MTFPLPLALAHGLAPGFWRAWLPFAVLGEPPSLERRKPSFGRLDKLVGDPTKIKPLARRSNQT